MLYTFGCSFTKYVWPTWADLLLSQVDGENWGMCGGGNKFIFETLMECIIKKILRQKITLLLCGLHLHVKIDILTEDGKDAEMYITLSPYTTNSFYKNIGTTRVQY